MGDMMRCRGGTGEIQGRYMGDAGEIQGRYRGDTWEMQGRYMGDTGEIQGDVASLKTWPQPEIATARQSGSVLTCPGWKEFGLG